MSRDRPDNIAQLKREVAAALQRLGSLGEVVERLLADRKRQRSELEAVRAERDGLRTSLDAQGERLVRLRERAAQLEVTQKLERDLRKQLDSLRSERDDLRHDLREASQHSIEQEQQLGALRQEAARFEGQSKLEAELRAQLSELREESEQQRSEWERKLWAHKAQAHNTEEALRGELSAAERDLEALHQRLDDESGEREALGAFRDEEQATYHAQLDELRRESELREQQLAEIQERAARAEQEKTQAQQRLTRALGDRERLKALLADEEQAKALEARSVEEDLRRELAAAEKELETLHQRLDEESEEREALSLMSEEKVTRLLGDRDELRARLEAEEQAHLDDAGQLEAKVAEARKVAKTLRRNLTEAERELEELRARLDGESAERRVDSEKTAADELRQEGLKGRLAQLREQLAVANGQRQGLQEALDSERLLRSELQDEIARLEEEVQQTAEAAQESEARHRDKLTHVLAERDRLRARVAELEASEPLAFTDEAPARAAGTPSSKKPARADRVTQRRGGGRPATGDPYLNLVPAEAAETEPVAWLRCEPLPPIPLTVETTLTIGRSKNTDLVLPDERVSRVQARISVEDEEVVLEDRSSNGSYVNGRRVSIAVLQGGDRISIGPYEIQVWDEKRHTELGGPPSKADIERFRVQAKEAERLLNEQL